MNLEVIVMLCIFGSLGLLMLFTVGMFIRQTIKILK